MPRGIPHSTYRRWPQLDQDKALVWLRDQKLKCPNCGTRHSDWDGDMFAFVAESRVCLGCEVIEQEKRNVPEHQEGVQFYLVPRRFASEVSD